ncbi:MAG: DUF362 domain-containing protein [Candidatus Hermodarchaeota archaeon]
MEEPAEVSIAVKKTVQESLLSALSRLTRPLTMPSLASRVVIKPSILDPGLPGNTSVEMMHALVGLFRETAEVVIVESDNPFRTADEAFNGCGYNALIELGAKLVNLTTDKRQPVTMPGHHFEKHEMPALILQESFHVNSATLKVEPKNGTAWGSIKNLFGLLPDVDKRVFHSQLDDVLLDLLTSFRPDLTVVELTEIVVGERRAGEVRRVNGVVAGRDPVAVDAFCAGLFGLDPMKIPYLRRACEMGLGEALLDRIDVRGTEHQKNLLKDLIGPQ